MKKGRVGRSRVRITNLNINKLFSELGGRKKGDDPKKKKEKERETPGIGLLASSYNRLHRCHTVSEEREKKVLRKEKKKRTKAEAVVVFAPKKRRDQEKKKKERPRRDFLFTFHRIT